MEKTMENVKSEILDAEKAFAQLVKEKGVKAGFLAYAAENAVLQRGGKLIQGRQAIQAFFDQQTLGDVTLEWQPDFVDVSASGDLAYTYGRYSLQTVDENGQAVHTEGIFHTVWKRQPNGEWRYVWD
jgi:ketosteroid isomerase-like protein